MQQQTIVFAHQHRRQAGSRSETPQQTANRLERDWGRVEAIRTAMSRMKVHQFRERNVLDEMDPHRDAQRQLLNDKASPRSYDRWHDVIVFLMGRLNAIERKELGLKPRARPPAR